MHKVDGYSTVKLNEDAFIGKIEKLTTDLKNGMWMNDQCETVVKNNRFVRWIKCILSVILPINLFASIKANKVALAYFKFIERHKEHLAKPALLEKSIQVLEILLDQTKKTEKHAEEIKLCISNIKLFASPATALTDDQVAHYFKGLLPAQRTAWLRREDIRQEVREAFDAPTDQDIRNMHGEVIQAAGEISQNHTAGPTQPADERKQDAGTPVQAPATIVQPPQVINNTIESSLQTLHDAVEEQETKTKVATIQKNYNKDKAKKTTLNKVALDIKSLKDQVTKANASRKTLDAMIACSKFLEDEKKKAEG